MSGSPQSGAHRQGHTTTKFCNLFTKMLKKQNVQKVKTRQSLCLEKSLTTYIILYTHVLLDMYVHFVVLVGCQREV